MHKESPISSIGLWILIIGVGIGILVFVYWLLRKGAKEDKEHFEAWKHTQRETRDN